MLVFPAIERIIYGESAAEALRREVERLNKKHVFLIVSGTMNRSTDEVAKVRNALAGRYAGVCDRIPPHVPREAVLDASCMARAANADVIVTFGGGSVTDAGKMVRLCLRHDISDLERFDAFRVVTDADGSSHAPDYDGPILAQIAIPTTLSAAEFNAQAGCTDRRSKVKHGYRHPALIPRVIILDPGPTVHTPLWIWLSTGIRALDHAAEGLSSQFSNPLSDASFLHALRLLSQALPKVKREPMDMDARLECQFAIWLAMAGRMAGAKMGASHAIGHVLGGTCGVPHGYTSCVMLPHVLRYNRPANAARQTLVAEAMGHRGAEAADVIGHFVANLGLPTRLVEVGVGPDRFAAIASHTMREIWLHANPRRISHTDQLLEILVAAA